MRSTRAWQMGLAAGLLSALVGLHGCSAPGDALTPLEREVRAAARPILEMDPNIPWSAQFNRLVDLGDVSVSYLARRLELARPAAPDDLRVMLHTSLLRLLANPASAPRLSAMCLETTLDVLHFEIKSHGGRIGTALMLPGAVPAAWHALYPGPVDAVAAGRIDVEADRQAMVQWWLTSRTRPGTLIWSRKLRPRTEHLWAVLSRRYADIWTYRPEATPVLCGASPAQDGALLRVETCDYNLVRGACLWLGTSDDPTVQGRLIELVGHPSPVVAHNAAFALRHSPDERIRRTAERYNSMMASRKKGFGT